MKTFGISFTLLLLMALVWGEFEERPQNTCAATGDTVNLTCSIKGEYIQNWIDPKDDYISENDQIAEDYEGAIEIVGEYNIRILNVSPSLAGRYTCEDTSASGATRNAYAEVVVLETLDDIISTPSDGLILENDVIQYTCIVKFGGNIIPSIKWTSSRSDKTIPHNLDVDDGIVKSTIDMSGTVHSNGDSFICSIFFESLTVNGTNAATNVPECTMKTKSVPLSVHYGPRNTYISLGMVEALQSGDVVKVGQNLTCISDSNPPVRTYKWHIRKDSKYNMLGQGQSVVIESEDVGSVELTCIVSNYMGRTFNTMATESVNITVNIRDVNVENDDEANNNAEDKEEGLSDVTIPAIAVAAVGIVIIVVLAVIASVGTCIAIYRGRPRVMTGARGRSVTVRNFKPRSMQLLSNMPNPGHNAITQF